MLSKRRRWGHAVSGGPQAMFVVEYPCEKFCHIEVSLVGERNQVTLQQMWEKADGLHRREHEPELGEPEAPAEDQSSSRMPTTDLFRSAPGRGVERRR